MPNSTAYQMTVKGADVRLRMSRSFGDFYMKQNSHLPPEKQAVIAVPEVMTHTRGPSDAFLVLACDGIYDVMTNQEVVDFFGDKLGFTGELLDHSIDCHCNFWFQVLTVRSCQPSWLLRRVMLCCRSA